MCKWTASACVALAWSIIMPLLAAAGLPAPAQATTTNASITQITLAKAPGTRYTTNPNATAILASESATAITATSEDTQADTQEATSAAGKPAATWTVRQGDTLSAIATALAVPGGWPALYAANRRAIGPNPNIIRPGTVLAAHGEPHWPVTQPVTQPANHNQHQAAPAARADNAIPTNQPTAMPSHPQSHQQSHPQIAPHPTADTMPNWLKAILAAGLLAAIAFAIEPVTALARRRRHADKRHTDKTPRSHANTRERDPARDATGRARVVVAGHERLIITYSTKEDTVYVLTPPGEDPRAILRAARLILPEHRYQDLADHLGVPSALPLE